MTDRTFTDRPAFARALITAATAVGAALPGPAGAQVLPAPVTAGLAAVLEPDALRPIPEEVQAQSAFMAALERAASASEDPVRARGTLLARFRAGQTCYPSDLSPAKLNELVQRTLALPPTQARFTSRYFTDSPVWLGDGGQGPSGTSRPAQLTYSFPPDTFGPDGAKWGLACTGFAPGYNELNAKLTSQFTHLDRGREYIRSALASWRRVCGLTYTEVPDDGSACDTATARSATRGDIRIGGVPYTQNGTLAYNGFPADGGFSGCGGGDMTLNTSYMAAFASIAFFRNTVAHEHGHGLGFIHSVPCNKKKLMEPFIETTYDTVTPDEVRGAIRNYGDRYAGNHTPGVARSFGDLAAAGRSVIERDLGLNGPVVNIPGVGNVAQDDWFVFSLSAPRYVKVTAAPTGPGVPSAGACCATGGCVIVSSAALCSGPFAGVGTACTPTPCTTPQVTCCNSSTRACMIVGSNLCPSGWSPTGSFGCNPNPCTVGSPCSGTVNDPEYCQGKQSSGCTAQGPGVSPVDASRAGLLGLEVRTPSNLNTGQSAFAGSTTPVAGVTQEIDLGVLAAGTYYIRVWDQGGASAANQVVQTYDLTVRVGTSASATFKAPPFAIAGLQTKRCQAGAQCYYFGHFNSYATEAGATLSVSSFAWDLDGDGSFETAGNQPFTTYRSNGTYPVTLRVTDSNGLSATDTIQTTIFGATTRVTTIVPNNGAAGTTVPVTINGDNFKGVTSAAQVTLSGAGVTVTGTPAVNAMGTEITGLSFVVAPGAAAGLRNIAVTNSDGQGTSGTSNNKFTVTAGAATGACCAADGGCSVVAQASCPGAYQGDGSTCVVNPCPHPTGACCSAAGACTEVTQAACAGTFHGASTTCGPSTCPPPSGSCCTPAGACTPTTQAACVFAWTMAGSCTPNVCPQPTGACCSPGGSCSVTAEANCSGAFQGAGTGCSPSPCARACCRGATCATLTPGACTASGRAGASITAAGACNAGGSVTTPCCLADYNKAAGVELLDVFDYLQDWFDGVAWADFNGAGGVELLDIFAFLQAWFNGC